MLLKALYSVLLRCPHVGIASLILVSLTSGDWATAQTQPVEPVTPPEMTPQQAQAEARSAIAKLNQTQQAFYQRNQEFANTVSTLQANGQFTVPRRQYNFAINASLDRVFHYAVPRRLDQKAIIGAVFIKPNSQPGQPQFASIVCLAPQPGNAPPPLPTFQNGRASCGQPVPQPGSSANPQLKPQ